MKQQKIIIDGTFDNVVVILETLSRITGLSYKTINVIGMFTWMGVTAGLTIAVFREKEGMSFPLNKKSI